MEIPIYKTLDEFDRKYLSDWDKERFEYVDYLNELFFLYNRVSEDILSNGTSKINLAIDNNNENERKGITNALNVALNNLLEIIKFINNEIVRENYKIKTDNIEKQNEMDNPENDYSDTVPLERMIILEKLGIINYIQSLQNDKHNQKHTAEILSSFTGIPSPTIAKNLGVMLGFKKNDTDKNSPYKNPKNQHLANKKINQFNIDLTKIIK